MQAFFIFLAYQLFQKSIGVGSVSVPASELSVVDL